MKRVRWILLAVLITVVAAGASGFVAYGQGKEAGITEGVAMRNSFLQQRGEATTGAAAAQSGANPGQSAGGATGQFARGQGAAAGQGQGTTVQGNGGAGTQGAAAGQGQGATAGQGRAAAGGNFTAGQVKSVNGSEIEVTTQTETVVVKLTAQTQITKSVSGAASDIQLGERIVVQGNKGTDGTVEARTIQLGQLGSLFSGAAVPTGQGSTQ